MKFRPQGRVLFMDDKGNITKEAETEFIQLYQRLFEGNLKTAMSERGSDDFSTGNNVDGTTKTR